MKVIIKGNDSLDLEFDSKDITILVMLTEHDADTIRSMPPRQGTNYCVHPDSQNTKDTELWMQKKITEIVKKENPQPGSSPGTSPN